MISDRPIGTLNRRTVATVDAAAYTTGAVAFGGGEGSAGTLVKVGRDLDVGVGVRGWVGHGEAEQGGSSEELEELHCAGWVGCMSIDISLSVWFWKWNSMFITALLVLFEYET